MQTPFFAPSRILTLVGAAGLLALGAARAHGQTPRIVGGPGVPLAVNDPAAASILIGGGGGATGAAGKLRTLKITTVVDAPPRYTGRADPGWVWLTGSPVARRWEERDRPSPAQGSFDVRWTEPLTKAEFDSIKLVGADGKPLGQSGEGLGSPVWLDATAAGWEQLSRAAISIINAIPADQRDAAFAALQTATQTPGDHWRAALLRRAIKPATPAPPDFEPAALNTLALQLGDQWAGAIGRLSRADFALGQQVARRMLHIAYLPTSESSGAWAVVWADADPQLLDTLLTTPTANLVTAATSFLASQPSHLAWVRDDAGLRDAVSSGSLSTIGAVSLAEQPVVAMIGSGGQPGSGEPVALKPLIGQWFTLAPSLNPPSGAGPGAPRPGAAATGAWAALRVGTTPVSLAVGTTPVPAMPPGVLIGPFSLDWTLDSFRRQQPVRIGGVAASLLPDSQKPGHWSLYLESRPQGADADLDRERFRVWIGPTGSPVVRTEVSPGGAERGDARVAAQVSRIPGGWCAVVTMPAEAVDAGGTLRLAVEHIGTTGMRSCWPRPMLPWQTEPGRLAINTAAWDREIRP